MSADLTILFADEHLVIVNKPSGLLSVPGRGPERHDSVLSRIRQLHPQAEAVHRLDMSTSGIMLLALTKSAERHLKRQFELRQPSKAYIADVWGNMNAEQGLVDLPLRCDWPNRPRQMVCFEHGKNAQTRYQVLAQHTCGQRLLLRPITGRSHQLRVHMQALGHPILGDEFYAHDQALAAAPRLHLHAWQLSVRHPEHDMQLRIEAPIPF
ncbi:bifunctional tRNA pseudouridine(32) synthase/23S rRNA pseudouridine(746) synthase RluA [Balneatrix alpica]|uniref:Dual-specificity RNA pseudouridine synthase RluA n=1 Tax=Balneatrix alpica TaxID=75684 RepID=A0ABV5ZCS0_9GAMM|nr:bifunctional tRNA pseudouridine(32) synthase/23S rRNA pseudouridine(746) synthase RluA [Balneatrix alpica]